MCQQQSLFVIFSDFIFRYCSSVYFVVYNVQSTLTGKKIDKRSSYPLHIFFFY